MILVISMLVGVGLLLLGGYFKTIDQKYVSAVLIGIGAICFGWPVGDIIKELILRYNPKYRRTQLIEQKDERNSAIREKAGAMTNSILQVLLFAVILIFILLEVELFLICTLAGLLLLSAVVYGYYAYYYDKRL